MVQNPMGGYGPRSFLSVIRYLLSLKYFLKKYTKQQIPLKWRLDICGPSSLNKIL